MIGCGNFNIDNEAPLNQALVLRAAPAGVVTITAAAVGPALNIYPVASLPVASAALRGTLAAVSDATDPALGVALVGGGALFCLAFCTGSAWVAV